MKQTFMGPNISAASSALARFVLNATDRSLDLRRIALSAVALTEARMTKGDALIEHIASRSISSQREDYGWTDLEEAALCLHLLCAFDDKFRERTEPGKDYIRGQRSQMGGWGRHSRDQVRIITTALVIALVPEVATEADWNWLRQEWVSDLGRPVKLSYKGGFYLLAEKTNVEFSLPDATIRFLENDQNDDGGFGPWKNHPIGSDPWSTGVVLWGLSRWIDRVDTKVVERALDWLEKTQLPSGYWPYHYLDEGTSYALIGAVSALKALQRL